jgi:hypothetical protein
MSKTYKDILSELASDVRSFNLDDRISFRYLYSKLNGKLEYFLKLESKSREIAKDPTVWKTINCVELEDSNNTVCGFIDGCNTLKKSKTTLPEAQVLSTGLSLKVFTIDGLTELQIIQSREYKDYITREYKTTKLAYWIENNYLYIPNTDIEAVRITLMPKDPAAVDAANGISSGTGTCSGPLDSTINYPDYLITLAKQEVLKELTGAYKAITEDEKGDLNTNNKK